MDEEAEEEEEEEGEVEEGRGGRRESKQHRKKVELNLPDIRWCEKVGKSQSWGRHLADTRMCC